MENITLKTLEQIQEEFKIKQQEIIAQSVEEEEPTVYVEETKPVEEEKTIQTPLAEAVEEPITLEKEIVLEDFPKDIIIEEENKVARGIFNTIIILCVIALAVGTGLYFFGDDIPSNIARTITDYVTQYPVHIGGGLLICLVLAIIFRIVFSFKKSNNEE